MWMVHDYEEGVVLIHDNYDKALEEYNKYVESAKDCVQNNGEFEGEERVILAKVERQTYATPIGQGTAAFEHWDWKEDK
ncbi:hypothetical protein COI60_22715 [Bacillus toyonensis]|uniref:hypothetical protein n=1 Tax=Bacillus toyonensis TaxID=155322 RepID=UPI000BFC7140|nr:hypothetical protein [Bacillus toyonensis]PHG31292.1 hypothetical protein COI60_22715 [Bacillus toyonensis]